MLRIAFAFARARYRQLFDSQFIQRRASPSLALALGYANRDAAYYFSLANDRAAATGDFRARTTRTGVHALHRATIATFIRFARFYAL